MKVRAADGTGHRIAARGTARGGPVPGPLSLFCARLKRLQQAAGITQASLAIAASLGTSQMSDILNGRIKRLPGWDVSDKMVGACLAHAQRAARPVPSDLSDRADWRRRYGDVELDLDSQPGPGREAAGPGLKAVAGWPLAVVTDPFDFDLEVHRPVQPHTPARDLPLLPAYVAREHDSELERVVVSAAQGSSGIAVLVGGSSTGKTRACWEALGLLRNRPESWRLWHPIDPSRPEAALRDLPSIGPHTVIWLNEAQFYVDAPGGLGERVAAGLRELLRDPQRVPVLVLATLWPEYWDRLTSRPLAGADDPHAQARELLAARDITVPAAFTAVQVKRLSGSGDPRLNMAAAVAEDRRIVQFLAGAPDLIARYRNAPPAAAALISAAMDARRLGMGIALPLAFLEAAVPGYVDDADWDALPENWLEQALAYTATPCKGVRGPLTRIRPRSAPASDPGQAYQLADYLDQHGRRTRQGQIGRTALWDAIVVHAAAASDLPRLARSARDRGLYRYASALWTRAAALGDTSAGHELLTLLRQVNPSEAARAATWVVSQACLNDPSSVALLLEELRKAGEGIAATALLARDPAAQASLDDPRAIARLMGALSEARASDAAAALAARAASHTRLDDPVELVTLLRAFQSHGANDALAILLARDPGTHASLDDPLTAIELLKYLREAGVTDAVTTLADRAASHISLDDPDRVAFLLWQLREARADDAVAALLARDPAANTSVDAPDAIAWLLSRLRKVGASDAAATLAARAAAQVRLDNPLAVARLMLVLRSSNADDALDDLLARDPAGQAPPGNPRAVAFLRWVERRVTRVEDPNIAWASAFDDPSICTWLLWIKARAAELRLPTTVLAKSLLNPTIGAVLIDVEGDYQGTAKVIAAIAGLRLSRYHLMSLSRAPAVAWLLWAELYEAGDADDLAFLAAQAAARIRFDNPSGVAWLLQVLHEVGAEDAVAVLLARDPASHVRLDDAKAAASMLRALHAAGATDALTVLAARAAAQVRFDDVPLMLQVLHLTGAEDAVAALLARDPAEHVRFDDPTAVGWLLMALRKVGADDEVAALLARDPAEHVRFDNPVGLDILLRELRAVRADDAAAALAALAADAGMLNLGYKPDALGHLIGREPDRTPSRPWKWREPAS
jgi:transcriptional regulator with XRE-family HTH domain